MAERKPIGRPRQEPEPGERVQISFRITPELKRRIDAAATHSGRSQSQECELRLERSFEQDGLSRVEGILTKLAHFLVPGLREGELARKEEVLARGEERRRELEREVNKRVELELYRREREVGKRVDELLMKGNGPLSADHFAQLEKGFEELERLRELRKKGNYGALSGDDFAQLQKKFEETNKQAKEAFEEFEKANLRSHQQHEEGDHAKGQRDRRTQGTRGRRDQSRAR